MDIRIKHFEGKYPSFNVGLASNDKSEEFLSIKGCRIVNGKDGEFVSWPATKNESTGKYWNHCWANEKFAAAVLAKAKETMPQQQSRGTVNDVNTDEEVPF